MTSLHDVSNPASHLSARPAIHLIALAGVLSFGVAIAVSPTVARALEPQTIVFHNPLSYVQQGVVTRFTAYVVEGSDAEQLITYSVVGGCEMIDSDQSNQALITNELQECNVTAYAPGDETYAPAYAYHTINPRRVAQSALTGELSGSGVYGDTIISSVVGGTTSNDITYQYNENCLLDGILDSATASHRITAGRDSCEITATRPGNDDYFAVSTVMTIPVQPAMLHVDAGAAAKVAGDDDPALPWTLSGFVSGDTGAIASGSAVCAREAGETPGAYDIGCSPASLSADNYTFVTGSAGSLTITTRATPTATATATAGIGMTIEALAPFGDGFAVASFDVRSTNGAEITLSAGNFTYTAPATYAGADSFTYTVADRFGNETSVTVAIQVAAPGTAPVPTPAPHPELTSPPTSTATPIDRPAPTPPTAPTLPTTPILPTAPTLSTTPAPERSSAEAGPIGAPGDDLPSTGSDGLVLLLAAAMLVLVGFSLRRASRI